MKTTSWILALSLIGTTAAVMPPAHAQDRDRGYVEYRTFEFYRGRDSAEIARRRDLRDMLITTGERVHRAEMNGAISSDRAGDFYDRLNRVRDVLRHDTYITSSEYDRWRSDI